MATTADRGASRDRILYLLKTRGPQTAGELASKLRMTPMGTRQHLLKLEQSELVAWDERKSGVGRPRRVWRLSDKGEGRFPEGYADLAVDLLTGLRQVFGSDGLARLIAERTRAQVERYRAALPPADAPLARRVEALARLRSDEGYMASWHRDRDGALTLVENHCPICAAVEVCQGLCGAELELFRTVLGERVSVERTEHMVDGARRCVYRVDDAEAEPSGNPGVAQD